MATQGKSGQNLKISWRYLLKSLVLFAAVLVVLGVVIEIAFFLGSYLDAVQLTNNVLSVVLAEFQPVRLEMTEFYSCVDRQNPNLFSDITCLFNPPANSSACVGREGAVDCQGINPYLPLDMSRDDVIIAVLLYDEKDAPYRFPAPDGYWVYSNHDTNPAGENWSRHCGDLPVLEAADAPEDFVGNQGFPVVDEWSQMKRGEVKVVLYFCHDQVLNLPVIQDLLPQTFLIHTQASKSIPLNLSLGAQPHDE